MPQRIPTAEIAARGRSIYDTVIRPQLTDQDNGRIVTIDVETNEYEIDDNQMTASQRLRARLADPQTWFVRVGSPWVHRLGGGGMRREYNPSPPD